MESKRNSQVTRRRTLKSIMAGVYLVVGFNAFSLSSQNEKQESEIMNVVIVVNFETKPENVDAFTKILESVKTDLPNVEGCVSVNIFKSSSANNQFTLLEVWKSKALHQAHIDNLSENGTWDTIASHLLKDPTSDYFLPL